jgi:hypothetical protein
MSVEVRIVQTRAERRAYLRLPFQLHRGHPQWVPPLVSEERAYGNPRKNKALAYSDIVRALATRQDRPVGRIMGLVNHRYNEHRGERRARFADLECPNDPDVARALLSFVEDWGRRKGMTELVGPMGFSDQDPEGFQVEGFEYEPSIATYCNHPFLPVLLEGQGYEKDVDYVVYKIELGNGIPAFYERIYRRVSRNPELVFLEFARRRDLKPYIRPVLGLMDACFREIYGYLPMNAREMDDLARRYLPLLDPRFVKAISWRGQLVAFQVAMPNLAEGFRRARGRLFPLGLLWILRAARRSRQLDLLLGGVREDFRGRGLDVMLGLHMFRSALEAGMVLVDSHHELEDNTRMRAEMERLGGQVYKRFRIYHKSLEIGTTRRNG